MEDVANTWIWFGFFIFIILALSIDTFWLNKKYLKPNRSAKAALTWTIIWIASALIFNLLLWFYLYSTVNVTFANKKALAFLTGYIIEKSLSMDNLFVFYMIFHQLQIPLAYQQRVFSYGIWSAIVMRLVLILFGTWLVRDFHWVLYLLGIFLIFTGFRMFMFAEKNIQVKRSFLFHALTKFLRITKEFSNNHFFIKKNLRWYATPLFVALVFIEFSDLVFALDSIPAIFAITTDPFIVWSSNVFAILGLRALYFIIAAMVEKFHYLKYGIALILIYVGTKMLVSPWFHISSKVSLLVILGILVLFFLISFKKAVR